MSYEVSPHTDIKAIQIIDPLRPVRTVTGINSPHITVIDAWNRLNDLTLNDMFDSLFHMPNTSGNKLPGCSSAWSRAPRLGRGCRRFESFHPDHGAYCG